MKCKAAERVSLFERRRSAECNSRRVPPQTVLSYKKKGERFARTKNRRALSLESRYGEEEPHQPPAKFVVHSGAGLSVFHCDAATCQYSATQVRLSQSPLSNEHRCGGKRKRKWVEGKRASRRIRGRLRLRHGALGRARIAAASRRSVSLFRTAMLRRSPAALPSLASASPCVGTQSVARTDAGCSGSCHPRPKFGPHCAPRFRNGRAKR